MSTPSTSGEGRGSGGSSGSPSVGGQTRRVHWDPEAEPHQSSRAEGGGGEGPGNDEQRNFNSSSKCWSGDIY